MFDVKDTNSLVDTASNDEELEFSSCDIDCMMNCFDNWFIMQVNMWYWDSNIISYTSIKYNNGRVRVRRCIDSVVDSKP